MLLSSIILAFVLVALLRLLLLMLMAIDGLGLDGHLICADWITLAFARDDSPLYLADLLLRRLQVLLGLHGCLDLVHRSLLRTCSLDLLTWVLRRIEQQPDGCQSHQDILDVAIVLVLEQDLVV